MSSRITQCLLVVVAILLLALLVRPLDGSAAASAQAPAAVADVLRAKLIELVSDDGQTVAQLYLGEDGGGQLRLRSGEGTVRVKLGASEDGSGLILMDRESEPAVWLAANATGTSVTLAQKGKEKRVLAP